MEDGNISVRGDGSGFNVQNMTTVAVMKSKQELCGIK